MTKYDLLIIPPDPKKKPFTVKYKTIDALMTDLEKIGWLIRGYNLGDIRDIVTDELSANDSSFSFECFDETQCVIRLRE